MLKAKWISKVKKKAKLIVSPTLKHQINKMIFSFVTWLRQARCFPVYPVFSYVQYIKKVLGHLHITYIAAGPWKHTVFLCWC